MLKKNYFARNAAAVHSVVCKNIMRNRLLFLLLFAITLSSCFKLFDRKYDLYEDPYKVRWAWKPVYSVDSSYRKLSYQNSPAPVKNAGKIYVYGKYIFQADMGSGIHVIDNTIPAEAKRIGFLAVNGCEEIAIRGRYLYTNNYYDLITVDISNPIEAKEVSREKNAFYTPNLPVNHTWELPPDTGWYACPSYYADSVLVSWVKDSVYAQCQKID